MSSPTVTKNRVTYISDKNTLPNYTVSNVIKILLFREPHFVKTVRVYLLIYHISGIFSKKKKKSETVEFYVFPLHLNFILYGRQGLVFQPVTTPGVLIKM